MISLIHFLQFEIVYYAPREEKTWTVHISCKLPPEPKARVANMSCGLANFIPVVRILFFVIVSVKYCFTSAQQGVKYVKLKYFTRTMTKRSFSICVTKLYLNSKSFTKPKNIYNIMAFHQKYENNIFIFFM